MNKMKTKMTPLTVANTLDQSVKQRIEAPAQQTVKQAIQDAKLAPQGQFDVFDAFGKVVSHQNVGQFRDKTIYVGVQRVAGGAFLFDDDDDDSFDLDDFDELPEKPKTVTLIRGVDRQEVEPRDGETLLQMAYRIGFATKDGTPIEVTDAESENVVSTSRASDYIGCAFRVCLRAIKGGGLFREQSKIHPCIVPKEIIDQTTAFTSNRGRLEMGGLLIGHVDDKGRNVVVAGFFPEQTEATSGYCEFDGGFASIAAAACDFANERKGGPHTPNLRVIGWIHTHPDIGIFLSGIDVKTFKILREMSGDGRCVAVVVDPLRREHGVFKSPSHAQNKDAGIADAVIQLSEDLEARYNKFLNRLRVVQMKIGKKSLPFIMPGLLRRSRLTSDNDDIEDARTDALYKVQRGLETVQRQSRVNLSQVKSDLELKLERQSIEFKESMNRKLDGFTVKLSELDKRTNQDLQLLNKIIERNGTLIVQLSNKVKELEMDTASLKDTIVKQENKLSLYRDELNSRLARHIVLQPKKVSESGNSDENSNADGKIIKNGKIIADAEA